MDGVNVTNWIDKSTAPTKLGGATGLTVTGTSPTLATQNGLNTIAFDGAGMLSTNSNVSTLPTGNASGTYFVVARRTAPLAVPQMMFEYGGITRASGQEKTIRALYFSSDSSRQPYTDLFSGARNQAGDSQYTVGNYTIISSSQPYTPAPLDRITSTSFIDGTAFENNTDKHTVTPNIGTTRFSVGAGAANTGGLTYYLTGNVAEILVYSTVLSTAEREQVEGYLGRKWGLSGLITRGDHPYRSTALVKSPYLKPFIPTDITGCAAWFDAADRSTLTMSGSPPKVQAWKDKSSAVTKVGGVSGISGRSGTFPGIETHNGLNTVLFNTGHGMIITNLTDTSIPFGSASGTYFVVGRTTSAGGGSRQMMFQYGDTTPAVGKNRQIYFDTGGSNINTDVFSTGSSVTGSGQYTNGDYTIISSVQTSTNTGFINGAAFPDVTNNASTASANVTSGASSRFSIGCGNSTSATPLAGNIAEILIYNVALSEGDRIRIEGYLAWKWGLRGSAPSIPTTHSFHKFPPATVTP